MCHYSYDRLIDLAQRTGDRLIVHNPTECQNTVIMSVDEYEKLLDNQSDSDMEFVGRGDVRSMSSDQMLDQINRDIAIWRAEKEEEDEWNREMALDDEFAEEPPFDPFAEEDYHPADWHNNPEDSKDSKDKKDPWSHAGSVLGDRYSNLDNDNLGGFDPSVDGEEEGSISGVESFNDFEDEDEDDFDFNINNWADANGFKQENDVDLVKEDELEDEIKVEDIPFDIDLSKIEDVKIDIPFLNQDLEGEDWNEEPLDSDDDPVFYEEPV